VRIVTARDVIQALLDLHEMENAATEENV